MQNWGVPMGNREQTMMGRLNGREKRTGESYLMALGGGGRRNGNQTTHADDNRTLLWPRTAASTWSP